MQRKPHTHNRAYVQTMHILVFVNNEVFLLCKGWAIDCEGDDVVPGRAIDCEGDDVVHVQG